MYKGAKPTKFNSKDEARQKKTTIIFLSVKTLLNE